MKENFKKLYLQRNKWKGHNRNATCWTFYCLNNNKEVDVKFPQTMKCILCYTSLVLVSNLKTQARKGLILYNISNGITTLRKHVLSYHLKIAKMFKEKVNNPIREDLERQLAKKRHNLSSVAICNFFVKKDPFKKDDVQ